MASDRRDPLLGRAPLVDSLIFTSGLSMFVPRKASQAGAARAFAAFYKSQRRVGGSNDKFAERK